MKADGIPSPRSERSRAPAEGRAYAPVRIVRSVMLKWSSMAFSAAA